MNLSNFLTKALLLFTIFIFAHRSFGQHPVIINDSLVVNQRLYAKEKLIVTSEAQFKQDIKVAGKSSFNGELTTNGAATLNGVVKMTALAAETSMTNNHILIVLSTGQLKKVELKTLATALSAQPVGIDVCSAISGIPPQWWAGTNKLYTPCPDIKVGIRTDDPTYPLHVVGTTYAQKFIAGNPGATTTAIVNGFAQNNTDDLIELGIKIGGLTIEDRFKVSNKGAMSLKNVGTTPSVTINNGTGHAMVIYAHNGSKILQIEDNGLLRTREVRIDATTWADYVFDKNYKLPELKDVAKYIDKNHRLPGVPSAAQIKENGINVGEMQTLQMQKIEELTLYLIDMDSKLETLQNEVQQLKKENNELKKQVQK